MLADDQQIELTSAREVLIYKDFSNPALFYYASTRPAVACTNGVYQFAIVHYDQPVNDCAGVLSMVVNLQPDDVEMANVQSELSAQYPGTPLQFKPIPWTSGSVVAAIIGSDPVIGHPSLFGGNSVALSITLTTDQYLLLKNSGQNPEFPPMSVVYSLGFEAFRPQYAFSVEFQESRFRDWLQKQCSANLLLVSFEKTETFEKLQQNGVLNVVSENQTGDTPPEGFQRAFLKSLQSVLVPLPRFAPPAGATTGSWLLGYDCNAVHDIQNISRRLDTKMQISGAVERRIFIQGSVAGFSAAIATRPDIELPTRGRFNQKITVRCHALLDSQPLESVRVVVVETSSRTQYEHMFISSADEWAVDLVQDPNNDCNYQYSCTFYFGNNQPSTTSPPVAMNRDQVFLDIVPAEFYTSRQYAVSVADNFPWDLVNSIRLTLVGPSTLVLTPSQITLTKESSSGQITAFAAPAVSLDEVTYSATYSPRLGPPFAIDGLPSGPTIFLNPFIPRLVTFKANSDFNWNSASQVVITVTHSASNPQLAATSRLLLSPILPQARFSYWFAGERSVSYRADFRQNGTVLHSVSAVSPASTVLITDQTNTASLEEAGREQQ